MWGTVWTNKKPRKWNAPTGLGAYHIWVLGKAIEGYHGALVDAKALPRIYIGKMREAAENYTQPTNKTRHKYVAKCLRQKYKNVQNNAVEKARTNHGFSRHPYGENCGVCIGHSYPVSLIIWKRPGENFGRLCEVCNWAHNSHIEGGDRRRCGHQKFL